MKTNYLVRKFSLIVMILTLFSCSDDLDKPLVSPDQNESLVKTLNFNELPYDIKNLALQNIDNLKEVSKTKKGNSEFGDIGNLAVVDKSIDDKTIYTIALEPVLDGFYYDNLVATKQIDGTFKMNTFRYTPDLEWYAKTLGNEKRYETYTGSIEVFNDKAESVFQSIFTNGEVNGTQSKSSNLTSRCIVTKIESYGFVYNGRSHVEGINIWVSGCGGGDRSFLNGSDSSSGNPSTSNTGSGGGGRAGSDGGGSIRTYPINEVEQDILYPDCSSFEFSNGLNNTVKGAQTIGVNNTFVAYESVNPTTTNIVVKNILYPTLFFTMPAGWTNGRAATLTAQALSSSIKITENWFHANPSATDAELQSVWIKNMKLQMGLKGGSVGTIPLFTVRSPSPYMKRFFGTGNCG